jgi:hypothetical protein
VDVYSITAFSYTTAPALERVNEVTRTVNGVSRQVYKLSFKIPDNVPDALYPLKVKMYSNTLAPYSDAGSGSRNGSFDVITSSTSFLPGDAGVNNWNFDANHWDYWYEYAIAQPTSEAGRTITIYLYDRCADYVSRPNIATVGLFLEIPNFGARRQLYVTR